MNMRENKKVTGDSLAESLNAIILYRKIENIENMMYRYKQTIDSMSVDIPDFCKPKDEQFSTFVRQQINKMIKDNTLDYFYKLSLNDI